MNDETTFPNLPETEIQADETLNSSETQIERLNRLRKTREELKNKLSDVDYKLGEGRKDRSFMRNIPDAFWFPVQFAHKELSKLSPVRYSDSEYPSMDEWAYFADWKSFLVNLFVIWASIIFAYKFLFFLFI